MTRAGPALVAVALAGCSVDPVDLTGKMCPCAEGWTCDVATNTCVGGPPDARVVDAPPGQPDGSSDGTPIADARIDATPGTTCLGPPGAELFADDFPDLIGWTTSGGTWSGGGGEAQQASTSAALAFAFPAGTTGFTDYRLIAQLRKIAGTGSVQLAFRIQAGNEGQYQCAWQPNTGSLRIEWTRTNGNNGGTLAQTTIDTASIPGYDPLAVFTMEAQAIGTQLTCCLRDVTGASLTTADNRYDTGAPGLKTAQASGAFAQFRVHAP